MVDALDVVAPWTMLMDDGQYKDMRSGEKKEALTRLLEFARSGDFGGEFRAGQDYAKPLGNYDVSPIEKQGQSLLFNLLQSGNPEMLNFANDKIKALSDFNFDLSKYDPRKDTSIFDAYKAQADRQTKEGFDTIKRNAGFLGNLYSSDTIRSISDYQTKNNENQNSILAGLYDKFAEREINAKYQQLQTSLAQIPLAMQSSAAQESNTQGRINSAFQYGGLDRSLADLSAQRQYQAWLARRQEALVPQNALTTLAGSSSETVYEPSKWSQLLNLAAMAGGKAAGAYMAGG